jgi:hypothetical protein
VLNGGQEQEQRIKVKVFEIMQPEEKHFKIHRMCHQYLNFVNC